MLAPENLEESCETPAEGSPFQLVLWNLGSNTSRKQNSFNEVAHLDVMKAKRPSPLV